MKHFTLCMLFVLYGPFGHRVGEIFSSTAQVEKLFKATKFVIDSLDDYIRKEEERIQLLKRARDGLLALHKVSTGQELTVPEHPIGALHTVQVYLKLDILNTSAASNLQDFEKALHDAGVSLPSLDDYMGSLVAILRLQSIYNLSVDDLMSGKIKGRLAIGLAAKDAYELGEQAHRDPKYQHLSREWWEAAYQEHIARPSLADEDAKNILIKLTHEYLKFQDVPKAVQVITQAYQQFPHDDDVIQTFIYVSTYFETVKITGINLSTTPGPAKEDWSDAYSALCRGDANAVIPDPRVAYCTLLPGTVPYSPTKTEILSLEPFVAMFHDVVTDRESLVLREQAFGELIRAAVGEANASTVFGGRVGQMSWLYDDHPLVRKISQRVMDITGLDVTYRTELSSSEPFQVLNYGIGGQYEPHTDVYPERRMLSGLPMFLQNTGDRLATFMIYLDDVTEGGATVFPRAGLKVPVVKNAAAFWYNLLRSGDIDNRVLHAGCPVLLGQKWIANKWIREHGQEFRHSCGLTPSETHHYSGNLNRARGLDMLIK